MLVPNLDSQNPCKTPVGMSACLQSQCTGDKSLNPQRKLASYTRRRGKSLDSTRDLASIFKVESDPGRHLTSTLDFHTTHAHISNISFFFLSFFLKKKTLFCFQIQCRSCCPKSYRDKVGHLGLSPMLFCFCSLSGSICAYAHTCAYVFK